MISESFVIGVIIAIFLIDSLLVVYKDMLYSLLRKVNIKEKR